MKILTIGDITGRVTIPYLRAHLRATADRLGVDLVVANGENVSEIHGISTPDAEELLDCGIDLITTGNHIFGCRDIYTRLDGETNIIRPVNYPASCPGVGYTTLRVSGFRVLCINVLGVVFSEPLESPFDAVDRVLEREKGRYDFSLLDIHAEATSEKMALARYFDGRINIIFGTHTHVATADEQVLPGGSGYITDLGMSGPDGGILGTDSRCVIERFRTKMPQRFTVAGGNIRVRGALFTLDTDTKKVSSVERVEF